MTMSEGVEVPEDIVTDARKRLAVERAETAKDNEEKRRT